MKTAFARNDPNEQTFATDEEGFASLPVSTTSHHEDDGFLEAIRENPDDDELRLIYADWLEEKNDPRGEFIRLQYELEKINNDDPRREGFKQRESQLLEKYGHEWAGNLLQFGGKLLFRRGFPDSLYLGANQIVPTGAQALAASPSLANLTSLFLGYNRIGDQGAQAIAASPHLARLTTLDLRYNQIGDTGAQALAASPHLARLTTLHLGDNQIGDTGAQAIAVSLHLARLTTLDLWGNFIGDTGTQAIASSLHLARLTTLDLGYSRIGDTGAQALAASPHLARLTSLNLSGNHIGDQGAQAFAASPHLASLTTLHLWGNNRIGDTGREALRQRFGQNVIF